MFSGIELAAPQAATLHRRRAPCLGVSDDNAGRAHQYKVNVARTGPKPMPVEQRSPLERLPT